METVPVEETNTQLSKTDIDAESPKSEEFNETEIQDNPLREQRERKLPKWLGDYETSFYSDAEEPVTCGEAVTGKNSAKWEAAMEKNLRVLRDNNTRSVVPWPANKKVIESKWVFKIKSDGEFKARLVARGFQQDNCEEESYHIYAPVAKLVTFRMLMVMGNVVNKPIYQMDVGSAFLYGDISEEIYMILPGKNKSNSDIVCKVK